MTNVTSAFHGSESISYLGPKIWDTVPLELKELTSVTIPYKNGIKGWKLENCSCRLCKKYVIRIQFITVTL